MAIAISLKGNDRTAFIAGIRWFLLEQFPWQPGLGCENGCCGGGGPQNGGTGQSPKMGFDIFPFFSQF